MDFISPEVLSGSQFITEDTDYIPPTPEDIAIDKITVEVSRQWIKHNRFTNGLPWPLTDYSREILQALEEARSNGIDEHVISNAFKAAMANCQ